MRTLDELVRVADAGLHPSVRARIPPAERFEALREELEWAVTTAANDLDFARGFAAAQPQSGQPADAFLNRWLPVTEDLEVLAGPRYRGLDPRRPFVAVDAASRLITLADLPYLRRAAGEAFAAFGPGYLRLWSCQPAGSWPTTGSDHRNVTGSLGDLRRNPLPPELSARVASTLDFYDDYVAIHRDQVAREPAHAERTRVETREDLGSLLDAKTLFAVHVDGRWAGLLAAEPGVQHGLRGMVVVELLLDPAGRGRGYGKHLSTLLARQLAAPDDRDLLGTIHVDNTAAYRSALAAGRHDVGGEVIVALT